MTELEDEFQGDPSIVNRWCVACGGRFSPNDLLEEGETLSSSSGYSRNDKPRGCPKCGSQGVPAPVDWDVMVEVNWHELRILGIWASNFVEDIADDGTGIKTLVHSILRRLENQWPDLTPLTMGGELRELRQAGFRAVESFGPMNKTVNMIETYGPGAVGHGRERQPFDSKETNDE